jgi:hypothetical protein
MSKIRLEASIVTGNKPSSKVDKMNVKAKNMAQYTKRSAPLPISFDNAFHGALFPQPKK